MSKSKEKQSSALNVIPKDRRTPLKNTGEVAISKERFKSRVGTINATKKTYLLLKRIFTLISRFELPYGCQCLRHSEYLGPVCSLFCDFLTLAHETETGNN